MTARDEREPTSEALLHDPARRLDHAFAVLGALPDGTAAHTLHRMAAVTTPGPALLGRFPGLRHLSPEVHPLTLFDPDHHLRIHEAWLSACLGDERVGRARCRLTSPDALHGDGEPLAVGWYDLVLVDLVGVEGIDAVIAALVPATADEGPRPDEAPRPHAEVSWFHGNTGFRLRVDPAGTVRGTTFNIEEVLGWAPASLFGTALVDLVHPEDRELLRIEVDGGDPPPGGSRRLRLLRREGGTRWFDLVVWWISDDERESWGIADFRDAQAQVEAEAARAELEREFHAHDRLVQLLGQVDDMVLLGSAQRGIVYRNEAARALFARQADGSRLFDLARPLIHAALDPIREQLEREGGRWVGDVELEANGELHTFLSTCTPVVDETSGEVFYGIVLRDVTAERAHEAELWRQARRDHLTGLPNRLALHEHLETYRHPLHGDERITLCFVDLDNLKIINDGLGHGAGDRLLVAVASALDGLPSADLVARFGGDEFVLVYTGLDVDQGAAHAEAILDTIASVSVSGVASTLSASVGVASAGRATLEPDAIIRDADAAMYAAKRAGRARVARFDDRVRDQATRRFLLESALRRFLDDGGPDLALQPLVSTVDGSVVGFEALARWGDVSPAEFIPVAEDSGLIVALGQAMLERSLDALIALDAALGPRLQVAINVSARQLLVPGYAANVLATIAASGVDPCQVVLELTESALIDPSDDVDAALRKVRDGGVRLSLDDFGSGYSSLAYLRRYPIDSLKLDTTYIQHLGDRGTRVIAEAVATMASRLGLRVVAEGVETPGQLDAVREMGIDLAQGYLLGRPQPVDVLLAAGRSTSATSLISPR